MTITLSKRHGRPWWMTPFGREPFGDIFFDRLWSEWQGDAGEELTANMNFSEKDGKYCLTAELPGVKKEDISIAIQDGYLTLTGKKEGTKEENEANYYLKETRSGTVTRRFILPHKVRENDVEATYKDGVLTVVIPQAEEEKAKKIEIH